MTEESSHVYNSYTAHWISRVESMNNTVILVSGGIMSITIGAFINLKSLPLDSHAGIMIKFAWVFLASSLASAILLKFSLVISGFFTIKNIGRKILSKSVESEIVSSPKCIRVFAWFFGVSSVVLCLLGLLLITIGASSLLVAPLS